MSQFQISDEFKMFQQQTQTAFKEAGEAELGAGNNIDLPVGSRGTAKFVGATAGKSQPKVVNNIPQPGKPFISMEYEVQTPESHRGKKYRQYFDLAHHEKYSMTQKIQDWWDFMQNAGCPREVRQTGDVAQGLTWAQTSAPFNFVVVAGYQGRGQIEPVPPLGPMPTASATAAAMAQNVMPQPQVVPNAAPQVAPASPSPAGPTPEVAPAAFQPTGAPTGAPAQADTPAPAPAAAPQTPQVQHPSGLNPGQMVMAYGAPYQLESINGNFVNLINPANGAKMGNVPLTAVSPA